MHYTTDKGDIGVAMATADMIKHGFDIFYPISSTLPFDLIAFRNNRFYKIQVKYRKIKNGCLYFRLTRAIIKNGKTTERRIKNEEVDIYVIYCPDTNVCYYIKKKDVHNVSNLTLRILKNLNNQKKKIHFANKFLPKGKTK